MSAMAFMGMRRLESKQLMCPRTSTDQLPRSPPFARPPQGRGATQITCSDCGFVAHSQLDFLHHVSTHKVVENPKDYGSRDTIFPFPPKRRRISLAGTERRLQDSPEDRIMTMTQRRSRHEEAPADSSPLDLTTKPRRTSDKAQVNPRKSTPPTSPTVQQTGRTWISPGHGLSPETERPAMPVTTPPFAARNRHVNAPIVPRGPPPLIQVSRRPAPTDGNVQVVSTETVKRHYTSVNMVHPIIHQQMSNAKTFPVRQGETMSVPLPTQPHPSTLFAPPKDVNFLPAPVGPMATSSQLQTGNTTQRQILPKQGTPTEETQTVGEQQPTAPQDISDTRRTRYHRLGRVPEYLRGGTWHPNQPATVDYAVTQNRSGQEPPQDLSLEWARMNAISSTVKQQRGRLGKCHLLRKSPSTSKITRQVDKARQHKQKFDKLVKQDKVQRAPNHPLEMEQHQNEDRPVEQQKQQQQQQKELNEQPEQDQHGKGQTEELKQTPGPTNVPCDADYNREQKQTEGEATQNHAFGDKLWWQRLQELVNMLGERQKQDPSFSEKWYQSLFPVKNKSVMCRSSPPVEEETPSGDPTTITQDQATSDQCGSRSMRASTTDSDYISMDDSEDSAEKVSSPSHKGDNNEEFNSPAVVVLEDDNTVANQTLQSALSPEERRKKSTDDEKEEDQESVISVNSDQQLKPADSTSGPKDTTDSTEPKDQTETEKSPPEGYKPQPLNVHFFRCTPCNFFTTSKQKKLAHIRKHKEKLECSICLKSCEDKDDLAEHMQEHSGQRQYKCPYASCTYRTISSARLDKHKKTAHNFYQCPYCDYKSTVLGNVNRHVRKHTDERPYKCQHCPYAARVSHHLQEHMQRHAGERPFKCDLCSFATLKKTDLDRHLRCHTGEKPFACDLCSYRAPQKRMLARHVLKVHQKQRPYHCQQCDYGAFEKKDLVEHMRQHSGEKPWKCSQCGYTTTRKRNLLRHVRVHTGERPYKCSRCSYAAADRRNLTDHMRTHTDERPFQCTICGYGSRTKGQLTRHLKTHHGVKPYKCAYCPFTAADEKEVQRHLKTHPHQLSSVYSNLFNLLGTANEMTPPTAASDGVPSPTRSNESESSPSGSPRSETFTSGASSHVQFPMESNETVPSLASPNCPAT